jgi:hypothetical protein
MANTDEYGNKIAQTKERKVIRSANLREKRKKRVRYCDVCGFRFRGENHFEGTHHKDAENKSKKG